jgi:hypothetical protein
LLTPRPVRVAAVHLVGKEGNRLEEVATGEVIDPDEVLVDYGDDAWDRLVIPAARTMGIRRLARESGLARSKLIGLFKGRSSPHTATRVLVIEALVRWAAAELNILPASASGDRNALLRQVPDPHLGRSDIELPPTSPRRTFGP